MNPRNPGRGLAFRLLAIVCLTFLPMNLVAVAMSAVVLYSSSQEILASWERELGTIMETCDDLTEWMVPDENNALKTLLEGKTAYFTDGSCILCYADGAAELVEEKTWEELGERNLFLQVVGWESTQNGNKVLLVIPSIYFLKAVPVFCWLLLLLVFLYLFLIAVIWRFLQLRVIKPLSYLKTGMEELERENLQYWLATQSPHETEEIRYLFETFNQMAEEIRLAHEKDIKMYQAQLDNLRLQVNPHMLLNSFNMIYSLAQSKNYACIQEYSLHLVEYFRYALKETDTFVPLYKEMKFVESYIEIQKIRFPGAFTSVYDMPKDTREALVPPLLIENFVENAMKYALIPGKTIEVLINIRREDDRLLVSICDTGRGIKKEILEHLKSGEMYVDRMGHKHMGIWNCRQRMEIFYGEQAHMNLVSDPLGGTQVWLDLPYLIGGSDEAFDCRR